MKKLLTLAGLSFLLFCCIIPLGGYGGHPIKFTVANVGYCLFTYYWLTRSPDVEPKKILAITISPILFIYLPVHLLYLPDTMLSIPSTLAHLTGAGAGFLMALLTKQSKIIFSVLLLTSSLWVTNVGYELWMNKASFGTFTGSVDERVPAFLLRESNGRPVDNKSVKGQLVVLDFWNTGCGICFKKFPKLEQYHVRYRNNANIKFFAVNSPLSRDTLGQASAAIKKHGYTFPVLYADRTVVDSLFNVHSFPTVIVIDSAKRIVYRGSLDGIDALLSRAAAVEPVHQRTQVTAP